LATFAFDHASLEENARGAKAILPVHLFGQCSGMDAVLAIARRENALVIEDAAQAIGATDGEKRAASIGDAGCISFFPSKNLGAWGDGGAVVTSRDDVAARVARLRTHGMSAPYVSEELGHNSRLDALQAAVLNVKAQHLSRWNAARARVAARYAERLAYLPPRLRLPDVRAGHVYHQFVVRTEVRDALAKHLASRDVATRVYYSVTLPKQRAFAPFARGAFPAAEEAARTSLALPMYAEIADDAIDWVCESIESFFSR
jgi:dTDP-4-amino-4,6-dideoxygalactose transaminase